MGSCSVSGRKKYVRAIDKAAQPAMKYCADLQPRGVYSVNAAPISGDKEGPNSACESASALVKVGGVLTPE